MPQAPEGGVTCGLQWRGAQGGVHGESEQCSGDYEKNVQKLAHGAYTHRPARGEAVLACGRGHTGTRVQTDSQGELHMCSHGELHMAPEDLRCLQPTPPLTEKMARKIKGYSQPTLPVLGFLAV